MDAGLDHVTSDRVFGGYQVLGNDEKKRKLKPLGLDVTNEEIAIREFLHRKIKRCVKGSKIRLKLRIEINNPPMPIAETIGQLWQISLVGANFPRKINGHGKPSLRGSF
jgi:hypothetical protein